MFCAQCGTSMPDDAAFCPACGASVVVANDAPAAAVPQPVQQPAPQPAPMPARQAPQPAPQVAPTNASQPEQPIYAATPAGTAPVVVVAPAAPASNGDGKRRGIIIGAAVVAVLAALVAVLMVTGVIGPKSLAGANAVQASSVTRIVPQSANGARIVQYTATLYDDAGKTVASVDVSNSSGFTMSDFKAPELKKGSYTIDIRDKQTNTSYTKMPVAYDPDNDKAPEKVAVTPPATDGGAWTVQPNPEQDVTAEERAVNEAYYKKIQEQQKKNGEGQVKQLGGARVAVGVSLVKLLDFDNDGTMELLVGYTEKNAESISDFSGIGTYRVDVYGWMDGKVVQLATCTPDYTNGGFWFFTLYNANQSLVSNVSYEPIQGGGFNHIYELGTLKDGSFQTVATWGNYGRYTSNSYTQVDGVKVDSGDREAADNALKKNIGDFTRTVYWFMQSENSSIENGTGLVPVRPEDIVSEGKETIAYLKENGEAAAGNSEAAATSQVDAVTQEAFGTFPKHFSFSSGAGAWSTEMDVQPDGTFTGMFHDSDMGDTNNGQYPKGTLHLCNFKGKFSVVSKAGDNEYLLQLDYLSIDEPAGEQIVDGQRQIHVDSVHGLGKPSDSPQGEWHMYMPGYPVSQLSDSFKMWTFLRTETTLPFIGLEDRVNQFGWRGSTD